MFILEIVLIYLLRCSHSNQDFEIKKRLLSAWEEGGASDIDSDTQGEIVYDFFKNDNDQRETKKSNKVEDDIIILPFFSDEVFTLSDIPEEKNWNFVEINSTKDLVAMENPKQRKYKTQMFKMRPKNHQVPKKQLKNNWNLFKHKFPNFNSKVEMNTKKEKRQIPSASQIDQERVLGDPWARVDIKTEDNPRINFGSYDEFGRKMQPQQIDRLMTDVEEEKEERVKDDMSWNITIKLDQLDSQNSKNKMKFEPDSVKEKNDRMNEFSEKLERLYEKLEALKNIKAARKKYYPRPPVGIVPKLDRPIAVIVRQDSPNSIRPALLETSISLNEVARPGQAFKPLKQRSPTMLTKLKDKLGFLIPSKIKRMLQKKSVSAPPAPLVARQAPPGPPWYHYGLPPSIQQRINTDLRPEDGLPTSMQQRINTDLRPEDSPPTPGQTRTSKSLFDILLPNLRF